jgi:hypothetical protein
MENEVMEALRTHAGDITDLQGKVAELERELHHLKEMLADHHHDDDHHEHDDRPEWDK